MPAIIRTHLVIGYWFQGKQIDVIYGTNGFTIAICFLEKDIFTIDIGCIDKGILPNKHKNIKDNKTTHTLVYDWV